MPTGRLITFEGIDGSGKSTQAKLLYDRLRANGLQAALFREPGGTPLGESIRKILLEQSEPMSPVAEMLLFAAARAELVRQVIMPLLRRGCTVLLDRFIDSTTAYQGYGREVDLELIESVNRGATGGLMPDLTFLVDLDPERALDRHQRAHDRMEREGVEFMRRVKEGYLRIAKAEPGRIRVIDGTAAVETIAEEIWEKAR